MKKFFFTIVGLALLLVLAGCQQKTTTPELKDCNDNNKCTNDALNADGTCSNTEVIPCCGNNVCEAGEGCNVATKTTACSQDCGACEAEVSIENKGCTGDCNKAPDSLRATGDSTLMFEVENLGEDSVMLNADLICAKQGSSGKANLKYYGYSLASSFENAQNSVLLSGKSKANYNIALTGKTVNVVNLECNIYLKSSSGLSNFNKQFFLRLE